MIKIQRLDEDSGDIVTAVCEKPQLDVMLEAGWEKVGTPNVEVEAVAVDDDEEVDDEDDGFDPEAEIE